MNEGQITELRSCYPVTKGKEVMQDEQLLRKIAADLGNCLLRERLIKFVVVPGEDYDAVYASVKIVTEPG